MGYATCSVASLGEAAALLENREVDVIVLDLSLRDRERH
jgi:CheY-like chemotaxis protein